MEYFHFKNKVTNEPLSRVRHFDIKVFDEFSIYGSGTRRFFVTGQNKDFLETVKIARVYSPKPYKWDMNNFCNINLYDTLPVLESLQTDSNSVPLLPIAAGLVLQFYLLNYSSGISDIPFIYPPLNGCLLLDKFPMYGVYDSIYCLLDAELKSEKYTFRECQVIQY